MQESQRDAGLARVVTSRSLAASIINVVIGAGIFAVPAALAGSIGAYAPLAFLLCAAVIGSVAICFAEGGSRIPTSGGAYGYIYAAFGSFVGYIAGNLLWIADVLSCGAIAAALADVVAGLFSKALVAQVPIHALVVAGAIGGIAIINLGGVARGARWVEWVTILKLIPLAIFLIAGVSAIHGSNFRVVASPSTAGFGRAMILALFAYTGMEVSVSGSGEVADPARAIPRALVMAMVPVTFLYIAIQVIAQGILGSSLANSNAPLADAMGRIHPSLRLLMLAGAAISMFAWIGSDILASPRVLFAFGREGSLPRVLGRVHPRTHVPHVAILTYAALAIALGISGTFAELAVLGTLATAVVYMLACAAAWRLTQRGISLAGPPLNFKWIGPAMVIGILSMAILIALASRAEITGLVAVIGISMVAYPTFRRFRKPVPTSADFVP